jgi:hypothetical protein
MALDELTDGEAAELGPLLRALAAALRQVTGCQKTYVALFAEADRIATEVENALVRPGAC